MKACLLFMLSSLPLSKVNASAKARARGGCVPPDSGGTTSCAAACAPPSARGTSPSTRTPACASAERARSRVCGRARGLTPTPAGRGACEGGVFMHSRPVESISAWFSRLRHKQVFGIPLSKSHKKSLTQRTADHSPRNLTAAGHLRSCVAQRLGDSDHTL